MRRPRQVHAASRRRRSRSHGALFAVSVAAATLLAACAPDLGQQVTADVEPAPVTAGEARAVADSLWAFAADLHRALVERDPLANAVVSPVPVAAGLTQAWSGAGGATREQLGRVLHLDEGDEDAMAAAARTLPRLSGTRANRDTGREGEITVMTPASLWAQRATTFGVPWLTGLAETWDTGVRVTDFRSDPEAARRTINEWMADTSADYLDPLLDRGSLDQFTRFLATSGAALRAPWSHPFDRRDTRLADFERLDGTVVSVPLMRRFEDTDARMATGDDWTAVEVPYLGDELHITFVVPDPGRFGAVETSLDGPGLVQLRRALRRTPVDVSVPQFAVTSDLRLDDALRTLGVVDAFDRAVADFAGITDDEPLALGGVAHQTFLAIDEEGTEASGSPPRSTTTSTTTTTTTVSSPASSPSTSEEAPSTVTPRPPPVDSSDIDEGRAIVVVDRPFLVLVTDRATGVPLFYGRVVAPRG
ncbi:serpin family protein [Rhabdothermincola salaria]|uniref:serpin family protein n=1 Tax=Rhabdothermincola salaria TaxID=2903142 RepID=UPI001E57E5A7|nr:serpin family protein [Rhabdothermincola salaria]MCD9624597.1 serpin family protein [Rhabdothermincola salaria]